ncbi:beta-ketoacyl-ACP synthase III [Halomonas sp. McH1-25]|uniref:beta-ketoacyl-ACP synthase III n=1 Tax=unclassified Halomonas TaxID=2609666 RepID=UPI001EF5E525|nr:MULTISPECIES: beta-ketoacyl-ACP synthase III [unclassified Halomonas]MCG7602151.1 beta-ketoacyl-ACP synthase III [Halomonas sp. McH1-25]MCP1344218.1 beta-ketoacyl-ACP synthase III [Halomonas sp. FL8]MCP1360791.1 beta-ketoacyl-ACP synthase III [Halomonas sp. BBD45]
MTNAVITGTGLYTPEHAIDNDTLVAAFNTWVDRENANHADAIARGDREPLAYSSSEFIVKASGIQSRYVLDAQGILDPDRMRPYLPQRRNDEASIQCEMGVAAARAALDRARVEPAEIDMLIVACSNLERPYPAVAVELQAALGTGGYAFDMNVACSSATFAIETANNAIASGSVRRALVINPEICSAHLNFRDRDSHFIFGDACTAVVVEARDLVRADIGYEILGTRLLTRFSNAIRNNAGFLNRASDSDPLAQDKLFVQEGRRVFKEVCPLVAQLITEHLEALQLSGNDLDRLWLHQANRHMNDLIARKVLGFDPSETQAPVILDRYANTSSAGSIIAFHLHRDDLPLGALGVICSFGAGYSAGSVIVRRINE